MKDQYEYQKLADVLRAVAHPTRLRIIDALLNCQGCVKELEKAVGKKQAIVSQHLFILRSAGVVDFMVKGKTRCYFLKNVGKIKKLLAVR